MTLTMLLLLTLLSGAMSGVAAAKENIVPAVKAVQSSTYNKLADAEHAVDGNSDSHYFNGSCTHTMHEKDPWLRVELPGVYDVTSVAITNRGDCCGFRINGAQIRIGNSLENNGNDNKLVAVIGPLQDGATRTYRFKATEGRYVNIFLPGEGKILTVCEVKVFTENIAIGAKVVQSSTYNELAYAEHAVDGSSDSHYLHGSCSHTNYEKNPWLRVELPSIYNITSVTITNRGDCCGQRIHGAQIRIGNSLKNNGNRNKLVALVGFLHNGATKTYSFKATEGRFVNIFLPGKEKILTLCEVKVFADEESVHLPENIAVGSRAVQSSTYNKLAGAEHAVDGNSDSHYLNGSCTHTMHEKDPWLRVELPGVYVVTSVAITNRGDCCGLRINGAQIRVGNSLKNNGNDNKLVATVGNLENGAEITYNFTAEGRFVNIFLPGEKKILTVCEVKVFADEESLQRYENIVPAVKAVQSSTYNKLADAEHAVDGNSDSHYFNGSCTHTNYEKDPWLRVELPGVYDVTSVAITNRGDCCGFRINGAQIRIGNSLENNGNNNKLVAVIGPLLDGATRTYRFKATEGRYVNIFLPGEGKILTVCEVKVFTDEVTSPESFHLHDYDVLPNVALKGLANQSSIHPYGLLAGFALARNAIDGNRNSDLRKGSCTQTDMESSPWWRVSLQQKSKIFSVALTRQADHCFQCMDGAEIRIGDSLQNDGKDNPLCATVSSTPAGHTEHYTCSSLLEGSHVTVILPGEDKLLSLCEVEVFGL